MIKYGLRAGGGKARSPTTSIDHTLNIYIHLTYI